jgi:hypothetical protein
VGQAVIDSLAGGTALILFALAVIYAFLFLTRDVDGDARDCGLCFGMALLLAAAS